LLRFTDRRIAFLLLKEVTVGAGLLALASGAVVLVLSSQGFWDHSLAIEALDLIRLRFERLKRLVLSFERLQPIANERVLAFHHWLLLVRLEVLSGLEALAH
jgi:hypothetical protein